MINYLPPSMADYAENLQRMYPEETRTTYHMTFQVTEDCCMACTYCYQHNKTSNKMTFEVAKIIIDKLLNNEFEFVNLDNTFAIIVDFIGGEPLLEIDLIEQICEYFIHQMIILNHPWLYFIRFSLCSNGLLYNTPKVQKFFQKYNFFVSFSVSIDGDKDLHDQCRLDLYGNGTYDRAISAVHQHKNLYGYLPDTKMTLAPSNIQYTKQALLNLINEGYTKVPFNCIYEKGWEYSHAKILYNELKGIADYLIFNNLYNKINMRMFNENSFQPMSEEENDNWCGGTDMKCVAFDYKGDMYPCIRYMNSSLNGRQKGINVGNAKTGYLSTQEEKNNFELVSNITRRSQSTDKCFYCPIAAGCSWCSGYNYEEFGTPNKRTTYTCVMHQAQSLANVYYWNKLYQYLNIDKKFKMYIPKEWALNIIDEEEYNYLLNLSKEDAS